MSSYGKPTQMFSDKGLNPVPTYSVGSMSCGLSCLSGFLEPYEPRSKNFQTLFGYIWVKQSKFHLINMYIYKNKVIRRLCYFHLWMAPGGERVTRTNRTKENWKTTLPAGIWARKTKGWLDLFVWVFIPSTHTCMNSDHIVDHLKSLCTFAMARDTQLAIPFD